MSSVAEVNQSMGNEVSSSQNGAEIERNKRLMRKLMEEGFSQGNLAVADELIAPNCVDHQFFGPGHPDGPEGTKMVIAYLHRLMPDYKITIQDTIAGGDKVWMRLRSEGTPTSEFSGKPPTGAKVAVDVIDICRFENGKVVEHWGIADRFHMMIQLGVIPASSATMAQAD